MVKTVAGQAGSWPPDFDQQLSIVGCTVPFKTIEIHSNGEITLCCYTWLPELCGNILSDSPQQILDNARRQDILAGMRQGRFDRCTDHCPRISQFLMQGSNPDIVPTEQLAAAVHKAFYHIYLTYDKSCNLQCPSCRKNLIVHKLNDTDNPTVVRLLAIHHKVKQLIQMLLYQGHAVQLNITGSGDPFASPLYWNYLTELAAQPQDPRLTLALCTNGVLMTAAHWQRIRSLWPHIASINVSIDAATEQTYKVVRKNGNFAQLKHNLDHLDSMIAGGHLPNLHTWTNNFIVQRDNFRELTQFIEWQLTYEHLNVIWTNLIAQWSHITDEEYRDMAIWQQANPHRAELVDMLKNPVFDDPRIYLGNMSTLRSGVSD